MPNQDEPADARELRSDFVSSLAAGLRVLAVFTPERHELGVGEIARLVDMDKRRAQRLVSTLYSLGYLEQDTVSRRYRPGVAVLDLGFAALDSLGVEQVARPFMRQLLQSFGQSVNLAVPAGTHVVMVECLRGERYRIGVQVQVGDRLPMHLSSLGKVILAQLSDEQLDVIIDGFDFEQQTDHAVPTAEELRRQISVIRRRGYAIMDQETSVGVRSVAAPVRTREGGVVGAVNVAMPSPLVTLRELESGIAPAVVAAAEEISRRLVRSPRAVWDTLPISR